MPRCCEQDAAEFAPCYASVLVFGHDGLEPAVEKAEESTQGVISCFTAWCSRCQTRYLLSGDVALFPTPSAHHTHKLVLLENLVQGGVYPR